MMKTPGLVYFKIWSTAEGLALGTASACIDGKFGRFVHSAMPNDAKISSNKGTSFFGQNLVFGRPWVPDLKIERPIFG